MMSMDYTRSSIGLARESTRKFALQKSTREHEAETNDGSSEALLAKHALHWKQQRLPLYQLPTASKLAMKTETRNNDGDKNEAETNDGTSDALLAAL